MSVTAVITTVTGPSLDCGLPAGGSHTHRAEQGVGYIAGAQ